MGRHADVINDPIGLRIEAARERRGLTRTTTAQLAGMTPRVLYARLRDGDWRTRHLAQVAAALGVPLEELTGVER